MNYFVLTLKHKWFVLLAGLKTRAPLWRLLIHDWTKLLPHNLRAYQNQFFGGGHDPQGFACAWLRHQNAHPHHWEYWIPRTGHNRCDPPYEDNAPLLMPDWAVREMVADWMGASRAYEGRWPNIHDWTWLKKAFPQMRLHLYTEHLLACLLAELGALHEHAPGCTCVTFHAYLRGKTP